MNQPSKFLSSVYSDELIKAIIEEAITCKSSQYSIHIIDHQTNWRYVLTVGQLAEVRQSYPARTNIAVEKSDVIPRAQSVGYADLMVEESALILIRENFGAGDRGLMAISKINNKYRRSNIFILMAIKNFTRGHRYRKGF